MDEDKFKRALFNCQLSAKQAEQWFQDVLRVLSALPDAESRKSVKVAWEQAEKACKALGKEIQKAKRKAIPLLRDRNKK